MDERSFTVALTLQDGYAFTVDFGEGAGLRTTVAGTLVRNERGRLRVGEIRVRLAPAVAPEARERIGRCLELFEDFCVVTESVRRGLPVAVEVVPEPAPGPV